MKIAFKNFLMTLKRYKVASLLNVLGLTLAFVAFYIIASQVYYSISYNRPIEDSDRIYLVSAEWGSSKMGDAEESWSLNCPQPVSYETMELCPDVEAGASMHPRQTSAVCGSSATITTSRSSISGSIWAMPRWSICSPLRPWRAI